jgi:threonine dehydrogenase-like Zn-dependent dehydrogenase
MAISAYRLAGGQGRVLAAARYDHQASMATKLGADDLFRGRSSEALYKWTLDRAEPSASGSNGSSGGIYRPEIGKPVLLGGVDCVIDCVGSSQSIDDSMRLTRPRGTVVLAGMPGSPSNVDWTSIWYKELRLQGSYAYGWESLSYGETRRVRTMDLALSFLQQQPALQELVNKRFPLDSYQSALETAFNAGRTGALKTVFEVN